jgi:hypothetical protein
VPSARAVCAPAERLDAPRRRLAGCLCVCVCVSQYWTGKDAPEATRTKKISKDKGSLDDDLDSYFAAKAGGGAAAEAAE